MGKEPTPLEKVTKDADVLRKQIDKILKESTKNANNKKLQDKEIKLKANFRSCYELIPQVTALLQRANDLTEENEGPKVKNFEQKKKKEVARITGWQTSIDDVMKKLLPEEEGETYRKELKKELGGEESEEEEGETDDEDDDDDDAEEEEDSKMEETVKTEADETEAGDDEGDDDDDEEGDETAGETLADTQKTEGDDDDDEEVDEEEVEEEETEGEEEEEQTVETKKGAKTTPKKVADEDDNDDEDDDDDDEDDEDEDEEGEGEEGQTTMEITTSGRLFEALYDYEADQKGDLSFKAGDILTILTTQEDGWWEAENDKGKKGNVPSTYLKMYNKYKDVQQEDEEEEEEEEEEEADDGKKSKSTKKRRSGKELWSGIKKAVNETSVTDVLHAMGAVPSGFRVSTLAQKFNMESAYLMKNYLSPKLSASNFSYRDLFYDPAESKIRAKFVREQRIVTIANCRQIPVPGEGLEVKSRHVRMCLFDGQNILSNIHTVRVASVDKDQRTWSFSTRVNDLMDTYQHAEVFIRTSSIVPNIGILFELCVSYLRTSTNERGEFSCGWTHLPLEDEATGQPVQNKTYDLHMSGGTPYEKGVEVDPSISRRTTTNSFMSMLSGNKQPRLTVKLAVPKKDQKELLDHLPDTLIGNVSLLQMYSFYRNILADTLIRDRIDLESTEIIHSPFLATFPMIADQHDLMKLLRESWIEKLRGIRKAEMRDAEFMKDTFKKVLMESVYPLCNSATFPPYKSGDSTIEETRHAEIERFKSNKLAKRNILALLLSSDMTHKPVDLKEVSFSAIGPYCLAQKTVPPVTVES